MTIKWTIYRHIHNESGRSYIGLTKKTMLQRWNSHVVNAKSKRGKGCTYFWNAIRKYGSEAFSHEVLQICSSLEEANTAEQFWIYTYNTTNYFRGFNIAKGGSSVPLIKYDNPEYKAKRSMVAKALWDRQEYRAKQLARTDHQAIMASMQTPESRAANKSALNTPESRAKRSAILKEAYTRPEVLQRLSDVTKGRKLSAEVRANLSRIHTGKKFSLETLARMSAAHKGKTASDETRLRQSIAQKGKILSIEHRIKISRANHSNKLNKTSKFLGVCFDKRYGKHIAYIRSNGKNKYLGGYEIEEDAAKIYDAAAVKVYGSHAILNFPV
jgi:hypothetical protein